MIGTVALLLVPVVCGVAAGYATGGRLSALAGRFRRLWLLWAAAAVQAAQFRLDLPGWARVPTLAAIFGLVLAWLAANVRRWSPVARAAAALVLAGAACNAAAIAANGRMPYSPGAAVAAGLPAAATTPKNQPATGEIRLGALGDTIPVAPLHKVVSAGDILIALGGAALIAASMRRGLRTGGEHDANPAAGRHLRRGDAGHAALHDRRPMALDLTRRSP